MLREFLGSGWHAVETDGEKEWAWSGKEAYLVFPERESRGFCFDISGGPTSLANLSVYARDTEIFSSRLTQHVTTVNIPPGARSCKIRVKQTWRPRDLLGSDDGRELGLCLHGVRPLEPAGCAYSENCQHLPYRVEVGLTGRCNNNPPCVMCIAKNNKNHRPQGDLPGMILNAALPYLKTARSVLLHGIEGEPLLSPHLFTVLHAIDAENVRAEFNTNGLLLDEKTAAGLVGSGLHTISVSLDAARRETFLKIRRSDKFHVVLDNIRMLQRMKKASGSNKPEVIINMTLMNANLHELPAFVDLGQALGVSAINFWLLEPLSYNYEVRHHGFCFNYHEQRIDTGSDDFKRVMIEAYRKAGQFGIPMVCENADVLAALEGVPCAKKCLLMNDIYLTPDCPGMDEKFFFLTFKPRCVRPWEQCIIGLQGEVRFCCHSSLVLGNLSKDGFLHVWNGETAGSVRRSFLNGKIPAGCQMCVELFPGERVWNRSGEQGKAKA